MRFEFATAQRVIFGPGSLTEVGPIAEGLGRRALVVTGRTPGRAERLLAILREAKVATVVFAVAGEPDVEAVRTGVAFAESEHCDLVIGCGGGAALDAGKAIAAMLTNSGDVQDYLESVGLGKTLTDSSAPFIAIPTTAGTGSEVTRNAVLTSSQHRVKVSLRSPLMLPAVALVDPELTYDLPPAITAATGMDALAQLIEPFVCSRANPVTDALCTEGIRRVARSLHVAFRDGFDEAAREDMAVASLFGGMALTNAGLGAVHGLAGPIGGMFPGAAHGAVCAALLPHVVRANLAALRSREPRSGALDRYGEVAALLTGRSAAMADDGVEWLSELAVQLGIPPLAYYGITPGDVPELVERATGASSMRANPIALTSAELSAILVAALETREP
jgi:alcohol dehydrogenase class IV